MTSAIEAAIQGLHDDVAVSQQRIDTLQKELSAARATKAELEKAIKTLRRLGGSADTAVGASPTKEMVRPIAQALLRDNNRLEYDDLYGLVREKLAERTVTANGLGLRMKEVLAEPWARETSPGVYTLTSVGAQP